MWRFILGFLITAILTSLAWIGLYPEEGFLNDLLMVIGGFVVICILGNEFLIRMLIPTNGEKKGISELIKLKPYWRNRLWTIGILSSVISTICFHYANTQTESLFTAFIPMATFAFLCFILQYIVPHYAKR